MPILQYEYIFEIVWLSYYGSKSRNDTINCRISNENRNITHHAPVYMDHKI